jgi:hypothetical protein
MDTQKETMMHGDWTEASRLAQSKSVHPSTSSGRTDLLLQGSPKLVEGTLVEELGFVCTHYISHRAI